MSFVAGSRRIHRFASDPAPRSRRDQHRPAREHFHHGLLRLLAAAALLAAPAAACPSCSLAQAGDTLLYIVSFMLLPYALVSGSVVWIKSLLDEEEDEDPPSHL